METSTFDHSSHDSHSDSCCEKSTYMKHTLCLPQWLVSGETSLFTEEAVGLCLSCGGLGGWGWGIAFGVRSVWRSAFLTPGPANPYVWVSAASFLDRKMPLWLLSLQEALFFASSSISSSPASSSEKPFIIPCNSSQKASEETLWKPRAFLRTPLCKLNVSCIVFNCTCFICKLVNSLLKGKGHFLYFVLSDSM